MVCVSEIWLRVGFSVCVVRFFLCVQVGTGIQGCAAAVCSLTCVWCASSHYVVLPPPALGMLRHWLRLCSGTLSTRRSARQSCAGTLTDPGCWPLSHQRPVSKGPSTSVCPNPPVLYVRSGDTADHGHVLVIVQPPSPVVVVAGR